MPHSMLADKVLLSTIPVDNSVGNVQKIASKAPNHTLPVKL